MVAGIAAAAVLIPALAVAPAAAHGFTSTVYAETSTPSPGVVRAELELEYDLLIISTSAEEAEPELFDAGMAASGKGDASASLSALTTHATGLESYVVDRFRVSADGEPCAPTLNVGETAMTEREGVPYARLVVDYDCAAKPSSGREVDYDVTSTLFPDEEGNVTGTTTVLTYDFDGKVGSAALNAQSDTYSTISPAYEGLWFWFTLGAEHLLTGPDHILFLLALIVGSLLLREVVFAASSFTVAHSVTFILAALGLVAVPASITEPLIALSIAVVALWHLWMLRPANQKSGLDRAGWMRLAVVFAFGLIHGVGFASALGVDRPFSWPLLGSLLVFNVGIEVVQLSIIAITFPLLTLLRRRSPRIGMWVGVAVASVVAVIGLVWFVERVLGMG